MPPVLISKPTEEVLKAAYFYRYITALDIAHLLYSPKSITFVRDLLSKLCGKADFQANQYLYRFPLPQPSSGRTEKIYTLGTQGRELLTELGLSVDWYFRPQKVKHLSFGFVIHTLILTRFLVAAKFFVKAHPDFKILKLITSYELEKEGLKKTTTVTPDAWILFGTGNTQYPVLLEIDRGTEYKQQFKQHVRSRIEFIRNGAYQKLFETEAVMIVYTTTGQLPEYRDARRKAMCQWTQELLKKLNLTSWSGIFRFSSLDWNHLYQSPVFSEPAWFLPDKNKPVALFTG